MGDPIGLDCAADHMIALALEMADVRGVEYLTALAIVLAVAAR